jgi:hypothetical protein
MNGSAFLLVVVGLLLMYVVISDKFYCLEGCVSCLVYGDAQSSGSGGAPAAGGTLGGVMGGKISTLPPLSSVQTQIASWGSIRL